MENVTTEAVIAFSVPDLNPLVERAIADATGADFGYINRGNVRDVLPAGPLLARRDRAKRVGIQDWGSGVDSCSAPQFHSPRFR